MNFERFVVWQSVFMETLMWRRRGGGGNGGNTKTSDEHMFTWYSRLLSLSLKVKCVLSPNKLTQSQKYGGTFLKIIIHAAIEQNFFLNSNICQN